MSNLYIISMVGILASFGVGVIAGVAITPMDSVANYMIDCHKFGVTKWEDKYYKCSVDEIKGE